MLMMIRNSKMVTLFWGVLAFYLLNISVDNIDPNPSYIPEDLSINDQESFVEIILEKVLGFENAVEEHDDNDSNNDSKGNSIKVELYNVYSTIEKEELLERYNRERFPDFVPGLSIGFIKIHTPPPLS